MVIKLKKTNIRNKKKNCKTKTKTKFISGGFFGKKNKYKVQTYQPSKKKTKHALQQTMQKYSPMQMQQQTMQKYSPQQQTMQRYPQTTQTSQYTYKDPTSKWYRSKKSQIKRDMSQLAKLIIKRDIQHNIVKNLSQDQIRKLKRKNLVKALIADKNRQGALANLHSSTSI
jgi:hypothetical protein